MPIWPIYDITSFSPSKKPMASSSSSRRAALPTPICNPTGSRSSPSPRTRRGIYCTVFPPFATLPQTIGIAW